MISVETADGAVPTEDEADVIEEFAKQLAAVLILAERVEFFRKALDTRIEPIAFFDRLRGELRLRYANKAAEAVLGRCGWIGSGPAPTFERSRMQPRCGPIADHFEPLVENALMTRKISEKPGLIEFVPSTRKARSKYHVEALAVPFYDYHTEFEKFRYETAGVICHLRVVNGLYQTFKAIKRVVSAQSRDEVISRVVDAMKEMGHTQGRLTWPTTPGNWSARYPSDKDA